VSEREGLLDLGDGVEGCYVWEVEVGEAHGDGLAERTERSAANFPLGDYIYRSFL
jgi:hypothetical protein